VIPAGEFQPSSIAPDDITNDFDIWRNIVRELSEELLGTPEHDGSRSAPIDYDGWPLYRALGQARRDGKLKAAVDVPDPAHLRRSLRHPGDADIAPAAAAEAALDLRGLIARDPR